MPARFMAGPGRRAAAALLPWLLWLAAPALVQAESATPVDPAAAPGAPLRVTDGVGRTLQALVAEPALLDFINRLASNWELRQQPLGPELVRIELRRRGWLAGGEGEAAQQFARQAQALAWQHGFAGYAVLEYSEGIAQAFPFPERVAQGVIRFERPR
jgi:hypothetical protein